MDCPVCKSPMIIMEWQAVEIDHCLKCRGIWLDDGELDLLFGHAEKDKSLTAFGPAEDKKHAERKCPACAKSMKPLTTKDHRVVIDQCVQGHGLWFDAEELEQVLSIGGFPGAKVLQDFLKNAFGRE